MWAIFFFFCVLHNNHFAKVLKWELRRAAWGQRTVWVGKKGEKCLACKFMTTALSALISRVFLSQTPAHHRSGQWASSGKGSLSTTSTSPPFFFNRTLEFYCSFEAIYFRGGGGSCVCLVCISKDVSCRVVWQWKMGEICQDTPVDHVLGHCHLIGKTGFRIKKNLI